MKKYLKYVSLILCAAMMLSTLAMLAGVGASAAVSSVTGTSSIKSENFYLNNVDTGVTHTQMKLTKGSKYAPSSAGVLNVVEIGANSPARFQVINNGTYNWSYGTTVGTGALDYNRTHNSTVLAAINACPWFMDTTDYDGDGASSTGPSVKKGGYGMPMGFVMIDGEIWNTGWFTDENKMSNANYKNWEISGQKAFYVLNDGTYAITATPTITLNITNTSTSKKATADAINRTPAPNSMLIYNKRVYSESLAYADSYEVYLECDTSEFRVGQTITGTVTGVYKNKDVTYTNNDWKETRPAIGENTVVISARGDSIAELEAGKYAVGNTVTIACTSRTAAVKKADQIIGGFFTLVENGVKTGQQDNSNQYPTSIVGIREDGSAILINITTQSNGAYQGARGKNLPDLCVELGCVDAFMFDGGGSANCVTLENNTYAVRCGSSDGNIRVAGNSLAIVYDGAKTSATFAGVAGATYIDGVKNNNATTFVDGTEIPTSAPTTAPTEKPSEAPSSSGSEIVTEPADIQANPSKAYRYIGNIDYINNAGPNGDKSSPYTGLAAQRSETITTPTIPSVSGISAKGDYSLSITGWALANGGQGKWYWSVDNYNWYETSASEHVDMSNYSDILAVATQLANLTLTDNCEANSKFNNIKADLTPWAGTTIPTVYFATSSASGAILPILQINNVSVPVHECAPGPEPTCTEPQSCVTCGKVYQAALGHDWPEKTCTEDWTCTRCGLIAEYQDGHSWKTNYEKDDTYHWQICSDCDATSEKKAHEFTNDVCVCGYERVCEHKNTEKIAGYAATCTEKGKTDGVKCSDCGVVITEQKDIAVIDHNWKAATCTAAKTCKTCGTTQGTALGHSWNDATCTLAKTCKTCGATEGGSLGHKWETEYDSEEHWQECSRCKSIKDKTAHALEGSVCGECGYGCNHADTNIIPAVQATCTEVGYTEGAVCKACGEITVEPEEIEMAPHTEETIPGYAATCSAAGKTDGARCKVCGTTTVAQTEIAKLAHTEETVAGVSATCTETGLTAGKKCSVCGEILVAQTEIAKLPHTEQTVAGIDATCTQGGLTDGVRCSACGETITAQEETDALGHDEIEHNGLAPTCTEAGYAVYVTCSRCDYSTYEEINATGHTEGPAATCTDNQTCTACGEVIAEATGHSWSEDYTADANGHWLVCTVCEATDEVIAHEYAEGVCSCGYECDHASTEWNESIKASCTTDGKWESVCTVCASVVDERTSDKLGHTYQNDSDADCDVCGHIRVIPTETPSQKPTETPEEINTEASSQPATETVTEPVTEPNTEASSQPSTEAVTEVITEPVTEAVTEAPEDTPEDNDDGSERGCGSAIGASVFSIIGAVALAGYSVIRKKKD